MCYHLGLQANLNDNIKLHGMFTKLRLDTIEALEVRFKFRNSLNVKW